MKDILYGKDARAALLEGARQLAEAVGSSMGPSGRNTVLDRTPGYPTFPTSTRDGVSIARSFYLKGFPDTGSRMIREAADKTVKEAGDGTTAAVVLAHAILKAGVEALDAGESVVAVRREIERDVATVLEEIDKVKIKIHGPMLDQVATISANNDPVLGKLIADSVRQAGPKGIVAVEDSTDAETTIEHREGMQFDCGYLNQAFVNVHSSQTVELDNPVILMLDRVLSSMQGLFPVLESLGAQTRPILIIAEDVTGEALATLAMNKMNGKLAVCCVKTPANLGHRKDLLLDIAAITGGQPILQEMGMDLSKGVPAGVLGSAKKIIVTSTTTRIIGGYAKRDATKTRIEQIQGLLSQPGTKLEYERLKERLSKLSGGLTILKLGAQTGLELGDKKDRCEDACLSTRCALDDGIVAGGGFCLAWIAEELPEGIVKKAITRPMYQIMENAGHPGIPTECPEPDLGWNSLTGEWGNLIEMGVIDPAKVVKSSLRNAASVATTMLLTALVIQEVPDVSR